MRLRTVGIVVVLLVLTNAVTFFAATSLEPFIGVQERSEDIENMEGFERFQEAVEILDTEYLEELDRQELEEGALEGMLEMLDDETGYLTPEEYQNFRIQKEGAYGGIGIEVSTEDDYVTIIAPISGTPGEEKGLQTGDHIVSINGKDAVGKDLNEAVDMMRGEPGSTVELEIERPGVEDTMSFNIEREKIEIDSVKYSMLENDIAHVEVTTFQQNTGEEFEQALNRVKEDDARGVILDLRNNPGGVLDSALEVAEQLVPEGPVLHVVDRDSKLDTYYSTGEVPDFPMVVMVNRASASASEILAGALQDTDTATVVGTQTYGKASVQNIRGLQDGGALHYTTARYQTPDGHDIHEKGLTPDVEVEQDTGLEMIEHPIGLEISPGDEGEEVKSLQYFLQELGYYTEEISGVFDDITRAALKEFQQEQGLEESGEMSQLVLRKLYEEMESLQEEDDQKLERSLEILENK